MPLDSNDVRANPALRDRPETYGVFATSWKGALARKRAEGNAGASSRGVDAAGAPFHLALREPCVRAPVRRAALVMLQHHGGRLFCRRHEHNALKTHHMSPDGLSTRTLLGCAGKLYISRHRINREEINHAYFRTETKAGSKDEIWKFCEARSGIFRAKSSGKLHPSLTAHDRKSRGTGIAPGQ